MRKIAERGSSARWISAPGICQPARYTAPPPVTRTFAAATRPSAAPATAAADETAGMRLLPASPARPPGAPPRCDHLRLGPLDRGKNFLPRFPFLKNFSNARVSQDKGQPGQEVKVGPDGGADHDEERRHGLSIQRAELDRMLQERERDGRPGDVKDDGIADMRNRDAVSDAGGPQRFARHEHFQKKIEIDLLGKTQMFDDARQDPRLVPALDAVQNPAVPERLRNRGKRNSAGLRLGQDAGVERDLSRRRPFQKLHAVEPKGLVEPVGGDPPP